MMIVDFTTGLRLNEEIKLLKGSDFEKFTKSLNDLVSQEYAITVFNITIKVVPRIGKIVTYFAELSNSEGVKGELNREYYQS
jgi:hypothetical protein